MDPIATTIMSWADDDWITNRDIFEIVETTGNQDLSAIRDQSVGVTVRLMDIGLIVAGDIVEGKHEPWAGSTLESIGRVIREWFADPDPRPGPATFIWFDLTTRTQS